MEDRAPALSDARCVVGGLQLTGSDGGEREKDPRTSRPKAKTGRSDGVEVVKTERKEDGRSLASITLQPQHQSHTHIMIRTDLSSSTSQYRVPLPAGKTHKQREPFFDRYHCFNIDEVTSKAVTAWSFH